MKPEVKKTYYKDGSISSERWHLNGKRHRTDGPAHIVYNKDGSILHEEWYLNGEQHRTDGPALIWYRVDGTLHYHEWYLNGNLHRVGEPASIEYFKKGGVKTEVWSLDGIHQRTDGPAYVEYFEDGSVKKEAWYLNGEMVTQGKFAAITNTESLKNMKRHWLSLDEDGNVYHYREIEGPHLSVEQSMELNGKTSMTILDTGNNLRITSKSHGQEVTYSLDYSDLGALRDYLQISKGLSPSTTYELKELSDND